MIALVFAVSGSPHRGLRERRRIHPWSSAIAQRRCIQQWLGAGERKFMVPGRVVYEGW